MGWFIYNGGSIKRIFKLMNDETIIYKEMAAQMPLEILWNEIEKRGFNVTVRTPEEQKNEN